MKLLTALLGLVLLAPVAEAADVEPLDAQTLVDRIVAAAGGHGFHRLGVLEMRIDHEETTIEGERIVQQYAAYVDTSNLGNLRVEFDNGVVLGCDDGVGWAAQDGVLDGRPQSPQMASGSIHQRLFPLLLPFSLRMEGVELGSDVMVGTFEGEQVYQLALTFRQLFFASPIMTTTWHIVVRQSDYTLMTVEFLPPIDLRKVQKEGVRYRTLTTETIEGVQLPRQVLLDGIDFRRTPTGHVRVVKVTTHVRGPFEPALFLHPDRLEALEERGVPGIDR
jgi:hypothetical protein